MLGRVAGGAGSERAHPDDATASRDRPGDVDRAAALGRRAGAARVRPDAPWRWRGGTRARSVRRSPPTPDGRRAVASAAFRWDAGRLHVAAGCRSARGRRRLARRSRRRRSTSRSPPTVAADGAISAVLDPQSAEAGAPAGRRALGPAAPARVVRRRDDAPAAGRPDGSRGRRRPALRRPIAGENGAQLDVGATLGGGHGPAPQPTAADRRSRSAASCSRSTSRGCTCTATPSSTRGCCSTGSRCRRDSSAATASARVEALASSLAGVSRHRRSSSAAGSPVPTGLRLRVDGVGR